MEDEHGKEEFGIVQDEEAPEGEFFDVEQVPIMQLSINALMGTSHPTNTFTLQIQLGKHGYCFN
jgi:hypothetical protein